MPENTENTEVKADEPIPVVRKKTTFLDIIAVQAIMCLVAAIAFVTLNIFRSDLAADIFEIYLEKNTDTGNISRIVEIIADFLQSTPLS
ncbi:MAG: hypothetical protein NC253_07445 [Ruminococcus sp.]|nr:hypothetical protein [Ruminococcus sp.]